MHTIKVLNAYIHDFASALWLATVVVIYWVHRATVPVETETFFFGFKRNFFFIGIASLVVIFVSGVGRTLAYSEGAYGAESERPRKWILIIKHILGLILYGAGTYWQYRMVYH